MSNHKFATNIQFILGASAAGRPRREVLLQVCHTPQCLIDCGFPSLPVCISGSVIEKSHFVHGITRSVLEQLADLLADPAAVFRSATHPDAAVVVTAQRKDGAPILVPVHKNKQVGRGTFVNQVASMYAKRAPVEARWVAEGLLLWRPKRA
jgi:hypothetical protein